MLHAQTRQAVVASHLTMTRTDTSSKGLFSLRIQIVGYIVLVLCCADAATPYWLHENSNTCFPLMRT